jgi:hypothetical protein
MPPVQPLPNTKPEETAEPIRFTSTDIVRVHNPTNEDFYFQFGTDAKFDAKGRAVSAEAIMYCLPAGQTMPMHGYMADYVCKHLTAKILQEGGQTNRMNNEATLKAWAVKIVLGKEDIIMPQAQLSEGQRIKAEFDRIQQAQDDGGGVETDESELPLDEAAGILNDIDAETIDEVGGEVDFPDANAPVTA